MMVLFIVFILIVIGAVITYFVMSNNLSLIDLIDLLSDSLKESSSNTGNQNKYIEVDENQLNDDLSSAIGIDYRKLRNLLAGGNFNSANQETKSIMLEFFFGGTYIDSSQNYESRINNIACTDIRTLDELWLKYSSGRFGFSVQHEIYLETWRKCRSDTIEFAKCERIEMNENKADVEATIKASTPFYEKVRWRTNDSLNYSISAPRGHLPYIFGTSGGQHGIMLSFFMRVRRCLE
ncbi:GUN4 domain-containing protein [Argonema antarcticum]|uniref:GUN4 domain-containing protein n=1 Tax=Argonema antarcticum TaxID=2942763 RepID=UPI002012CB23|nr:GUN4 domain-containing protein [Argonema antarcticum]MCL1470160.1 GUN4 domain-containing protein [Argonema antarcticum A004/B2]